MGEQNRDDDGTTEDAGFATKKKFRKLWKDIERASDEHWSLDLRGAANLIGLCLYPVGWSWTEYIRRKNNAVYPWEKRAETVCSLDVKTNTPDQPAGTSTFLTGNANRRSMVEHHLMRMIKRKEVLTTIVDYRMQGSEIGNRMRLDETLKFDVNSGLIGFNELKNDDAFDCKIDTKSILAALEIKKGWETNSGAFDWLHIERYARELFETSGIPDTNDVHTNQVLMQYAAQSQDGKEPTLSTLRDLIARLRKEYSSQDSEI